MQKKRFVLLGLTVVLVVGLLAGAFGVITRQAGAAVDLAAKGPSVGVDVNGNQFVFWQGSNNTNLYEAVYTHDTASWSQGAINLGGTGNNLASQPSVEVATFGGILSGGHRYGAQFVAWRGSTNDLWFAYWDGSWNGAFEVPGVTNDASTPSVAFNNKENSWGPGESQVSIWWEGTDGNLYYIRLEDPLGGADIGGVTVPGSPQWVSPHEATSNGQHLGPLGSVPGASNTSPAGALGAALNNGHGVVTWKGGTNSDLWVVPYTFEYFSGDITVGALKKSPWTGIDGAPSAADEYSNCSGSNCGGVVDFVWQDNNHDLEYGYALVDLSQFYASTDVGGNGSLTSAPSLGFWDNTSLAGELQLFAFFKFSDGFLHEAFTRENANRNSSWNFYPYPQFGIVG